MANALDKVAVVTGAARGIGRALAVGFAEAGYDVAITDLPSQAQGLAETRATIEARGRKAWVEQMDISRKAEVDAAFGHILDQAGKIDVLVNNAGILKPSLLQDLSEKDWDAHMDVNTKGVLLACQAALPSMRKRKSGRIVNIASIAGRQGVATQGHYAATKAAVITLTRVFAQEVGADGITVNAICPGIILTEMGKNNLGSEEAIRHWEQVTALKRLGQPEDIIGPALFFASDQSAFVTGQALNVCGGIYFH
ncbi:SDR family NAD(P)-dependent oxidoreductase [Mesorhizobium sp. VK9D]|uniref:SDR family NAD(P)-dependent oxidoreductase n=1 Tax=Mesorhizobium australafricanum TaxID=3072311 RepID=UPI002A24CFBF|nr:SDR family NAD(P)-dependent oxidoreductase [Mesorhizobium sp. VK9D]MDX8452320.1 SDR family NAD(P)-dependent oxidoreductase [Mesorhizobium sp. VK9D]